MLTCLSIKVHSPYMLSNLVYYYPRSTFCCCQQELMKLVTYFREQKAHKDQPEKAAGAEKTGKDMDSSVRCAYKKTEEELDKIESKIRPGVEDLLRRAKEGVEKMQQPKQDGGALPSSGNGSQQSSASPAETQQTEARAAELD